MLGPILKVQMWFCQGFCTLPKVSKTWGFCGMSKKDGRRWAFAEDLQRCVSRGRRSTRDMFTRDVRRSGCWFPESSCILEHPIFSLGKVILRDRCSTSYDLASLFRGRGNTLDRWNGKIAKHNGTEPSGFPFPKEVSHSCFFFDVVNLKIWGSLAE